MYDSTDDTKLHIHTVRALLHLTIKDLQARANVHDDSKLVSPEKEAFDEYTPLLKDLTYGSDEYRAALAGLGDALAHHYAHNSHHPEHYEQGVQDMNLFDVIEMFCDWWAASMRHADGNIRTSIDKNTDRFNMSDDLALIFTNTVNDLEPLVKSTVTWYN